MTEEEFILSDRITKIKSINEQHDLESNAYLSFSGGKDSTVLHYLLDEALPDNNIPRVYLNTGIEYQKVVQFVRTLAEKDECIVIVNPKQNIKEVLTRYGYPFKSKEHAHYVAVYQHSGLSGGTVKNYLGMREKTRFLCPNLLKFQFTENYPLKISDQCCYKLKKEPAKKWSKENNRPILITGMRKDEGGLRKTVATCTVFSDDTCSELQKFHPLFPVNESFMDWYIQERNIKLCELYYPPYNFVRTGCKGCPFSLDLQKQLDIMALYLPAERKQCENIWKPVYEEYRRVGYRLDKRPNLFDDLLK